MSSGGPHRSRARPAARRLALAGSLALCVAALVVVPGTVGAGSVTSQARPNIIVVTTDDQALSMLRPRFMPKVVEHIAGPGTTFTNAIVTTPLCCPSRASMLTGQYAHNHEVLQNAYQLLSDKDNVLPVWLRRAGYRTAHVGKFLNGYERSVADSAEVAPGWDAWFTTLGATRYFDYDVSANGKRVHFGKGRRSHVTRVINRKAATLIRRFTSDSRPLYLQLDHRAPHTETGVNSGGRCGARAVPEEPRDERRIRGQHLPNPPSFNEADVSDKPSFIRDRPLLSHTRVKKITKRYECALAALRSVDRGINQIVQALEHTGDLQNTVMVFTTDNGFYFGEHRIARDKTQPYEEALRVPLVMRVPPQFLGAAPVVSQVTDQVANIDLAPTFLELAGGDSCPSDGECRVMDGRSLIPLLRGQPGWPIGRGLLVEYDGASSKGTSSCRYDGIRTPARFYVEHLAVPDPLTGGCRETEEFELYDLQSDPFQLQNVYSRDGPELDPLRDRLARLRDCSGLEGRDPVPEEVSYCE
ncbi:MAG: sulfatase family protein [Solirubrobacterales bacterium]